MKSLAILFLFGFLGTLSLIFGFWPLLAALTLLVIAMVIVARLFA